MLTDVLRARRAASALAVVFLAGCSGGEESSFQHLQARVVEPLDAAGLEWDLADAGFMDCQDSVAASAGFAYAVSIEAPRDEVAEALDDSFDVVGRADEGVWRLQMEADDPQLWSGSLREADGSVVLQLAAEEVRGELPTELRKPSKHCVTPAPISEPADSTS